MRARVAALVGATALIVTGLGAGPAQAADITATNPWVANPDSEIVDFDTVRLAPPVLGATSVETTNLDAPIQAGEEISFDMVLDDTAICTAGGPRVFVEVDGTYYNSYDYDNSTNCVGGNPPPSTEDGTVTFPVPVNGRIGAAGVVHDNGTGGTVEISNLRVAGDLVLFEDRPDLEPTDISATLTATNLANTDDRLRVTTAPGTAGAGAPVKFYRLVQGSPDVLVAQRVLNASGQMTVAVDDANPRRANRYRAVVEATSDSTSAVSNIGKVR